MSENLNGPGPLIPGEMPTLRQLTMLLELFETPFLNTAFVRWERYRDTQIAQGRTYQPFLRWLQIRLIDGLTVYEPRLAALEAALEKDEALKL